MPNADEKKNICQCNCGQLCKNRFAPGHNSKKIFLEKTIDICECGCGKECSLRFVQGHNSRGRRNIYTEEQKATWINICACGCNQLCRQTYIHGHNASKIYARPTNFCLCGCGKEVKHKFIFGHMRKGLKKVENPSLNFGGPKKGQTFNKEEKILPANYCLCGCGAKVKNKFVRGHIFKVYFWKKGLNEELDEKIFTRGIIKGNELRWRRFCLHLTKRPKLCECRCGKLASFDKRFVFGHHPKGFEKVFIYANSNGLVVKMRSSWEVKYAQYLDKLKMVWKYEPRGFLLSNEHRYYPDFYLPELNEYHEIKGWLSPKAVAKINLFNLDFPHETLRVLGKDYLKNLGLKI